MIDDTTQSICLYLFNNAEKDRQTGVGGGGGGGVLRER